MSHASASPSCAYGVLLVLVPVLELLLVLELVVVEQVQVLAVPSADSGIGASLAGAASSVGFMEPGAGLVWAGVTDTCGGGKAGGSGSGGADNAGCRNRAETGGA